MGCGVAPELITGQVSLLWHRVQLPHCRFCNALKHLLTSHFTSLMSVSKQHNVLRTDMTPEHEISVQAQVAVYK